MFENLVNFFKKGNKNQEKLASSKDAAKERLHLVLMQDRANVSADFLELMKQEIIDVIKKYIEVDEKEIEVQLKNKGNDDGTTGAPILYANIPILNIKNDVEVEEKNSKKESEPKEKKSKKSTSVKNDDKNEKDKEETKVEEKIEDKAEEMIKEAEEIIIDDSDTKKEENNNDTSEDKKENSEDTEEEALKSNKK